MDSEDLTEELIIENKCFQELETQKSFDKESHDQMGQIYDIKDCAEALLTDYYSMDTEAKKAVKQMEYDINNTTIGWARLNLETDLNVLACLLFDWVESLKVPVLDRENLEVIVINYKHPDVCLSKLQTVVIL